MSSLISFKSGMSATSRKRKEELAEALKKLILSKGKTPALKYQQLFEDIRGQSDIVSVNVYILFNRVFFSFDAALKFFFPASTVEVITVDIDKRESPSGNNCNENFVGFSVSI